MHFEQAFNRSGIDLFEVESMPLELEELPPTGSASTSNLPFNDSLFIFRHGTVVTEGGEYFFECHVNQCNTRRTIHKRSTSNALHHLETHGIIDPASIARKEKFAENRKRLTTPLEEVAKANQVNTAVYGKLQRVRITIDEFLPFDYLENPEVRALELGGLMAISRSGIKCGLVDYYLSWHENVKSQLLEVKVSSALPRFNIMIDNWTNKLTSRL